MLVFAGDQDLICNYLGLENMIKNLTWNGATGLGVRLHGFSFIDLVLKCLMYGSPWQHNHILSTLNLPAHGLRREI